MRPRGHWRWLAAALTGVASLALAIYVATRFSPPRLEPLPDIPQYLIAAPIRALVEQKRSVAERNPGSAEAWGELGSAFARQCDAEALVCFRNAERLEPENYRWSYLQGACHADRDARQALDCFARSARLAPDLPHVQLRLADYLLEQGDLAGARLAIERSLSVDPEDPHAHLSQARLHFFKGNLAEARIWAEKSAALAPDKRDTHVFLSQLYRRLRDSVSEQRERATLAHMADTPTSWDDPDVASVHALQDSARIATKAQPAESDEQDPLAPLRQAQKLIADGRLADAEALIREQLRLYPDHERFHFQLGIACFQQERYEEAAQEFRRVRELKPDHSDAPYNLGHALLKLKLPAEAKDAFAAAVRLRPGNAFARINLAELLLYEGKTDEAREHLQAALQIAPGDGRAQQLLERAKAAP